jgi:hypothetical protein
MLAPQWSRDWAIETREASAVVPAPLSRVSRVPMWLFVAPNGVRIFSSLPVTVEVGTEGPDAETPVTAYVFNCPRLHVFASGATYKEAEDSFHEQVVHFFHSYRETDASELADDAAEIQKLYLDNFQESVAAR